MSPLSSAVAGKSTFMFTHRFEILSYLTVTHCRAGIMYTSGVGEEDQNLKSGVLSLSGTGFLGAIGRSLDLGKLIKVSSTSILMND